MQTQKGQKVGNVLSGPTNKCVLMCLSTHTNQAGTKVNKGQKQQLRQLKMDGLNFCVRFIFVIVSLYRHVFYTYRHYDCYKSHLLTNIGNIFSRWHVRFIPFAEIRTN